MKNIKVGLHSFTIPAMYQKASTKAQRALLGYMIKSGYASEPTFGSAFHLLHTIERYNENGIIYNLVFGANTEAAKAIVSIAESAMRGTYDNFAFSEREIGKILQQFETLNGG